MSHDKLRGYALLISKKLQRTAIVAAAFLAIFPIAAARAQTDTSFESRWTALIDAAKKEGRLAASVSTVPEYQSIFDAFTAKFGIRVQAVGGSASARVSRILAERVAGRYTVDIAMLSAASSTRRLEPAAALTDLPALIIHPEVTDTSKWYLNRHWYMDSADTKTIFTFNARALNTWVFWYNSEKLSVADIASIKTPADFLNPRWYGKMADQSWADPGRLGDMMEAYLGSDVGPEWVRKYLTGMGVSFTSDKRLEEAWIVRGRNPLKWGEGNIGNNLRDLQEKGLPIKEMRLPRETGILEARGSCCVTIFRNAPNPHAAQLFLNWFLSREGQILLHEVDPPRAYMSLREDIPPGNTQEETRRVAGMVYHFRDFDPQYRESEESIREFILKAYQDGQSR